MSMRVLVVDDEILALNSLVDLISRVVPAAEIRDFHRPSAALQAVEVWKPDVALLDIGMRGLNGVELAKEIQKLAPYVNIIFTTGYDGYTKEALAIHASGYLLKPITEEKLREEFAVLRFSAEEGMARSDEKKARLCIRTFGSFEAFYQDQPLHFQYQKTKELLAYLVDRSGALCSNYEIIAVLWEDCDATQKMSYLQRLRSDLSAVLRGCGAEDILIRQRGGIAVLPEKITCDYYAWLRGEKIPDLPGGSVYRGEYMSQYSWAEMTNGWIAEKYAKGE